MLSKSRITSLLTSGLLLVGFSSSLVVSEGFFSTTALPKRTAFSPKVSPFMPGNTMSITTTTTSTTSDASAATASVLTTRGGSSSTKLNAAASSTSSGEGGEESPCPFSKTAAVFGSFWGSLGVIYILAKAIKRVVPIALEPLKSGSTLTLTPLQWGFYALNCLFFAYAEGYKGFQLKFSPLVVKRSFSLVIGTPGGNNPLHYLFAPLYSMGLIHATKKRLITSWCVSLGVTGLVILVKKLNPVWRCIMDAGVVVGLTWGSLSILYYFVKSLITGTTPDIDPCLPNGVVTNGDDNKAKSS